MWFTLFDSLKALFFKYKELILYVFFGGLTTLVNFVSYALLANALHVDPMISNAVAWFLSVLFAYITNKIYVFESKEMRLPFLLREMGAFFACRLASGVMDMGMMYVMLYWFHWNDLVSKIIANVFVIIVNYVFSKLWIFKKPKAEK